MTQLKAVLCHFHLVLAIFSILFGILLPPSAVYAVPMQTNSLHDTQQGYRYHIVQHGDTLYNISRRYGTTIDAIRQANGLPDNYIQIGQRLAIPGSQPAHPFPKNCYTHHSVQMGETLFSIARSYNIPVRVLLQANPIADPNNIKAGEQLCIPKFEQEHSNGPHPPKPCSATSCCQTHCTPAPTPTQTEMPCRQTSCCQTHCCQTHCPPTWTPTPTPMPTQAPPTATTMPTENPCTSTSCCQTHCCQAHCPPPPTPVIPTPIPTAYPPYQGFWRGEYFDTDGISRAVRHDPEIDFNWGSNAPDIMPDVADNFSIHWTRTEYFDAGTYHFDATIDDGILVWIDGANILESWYANPVHYQDVELEAGLHTMRVQYYEHTGDARVSLKWTRH